MSTLKTGARYRFAGLADSPEDVERVITVHSVSTSGSLSYRLDLPTEDVEPSLFGIPYSDALLMVGEGIWEPLP